MSVCGIENKNCRKILAIMLLLSAVAFIRYLATSQTQIYFSSVPPSSVARIPFKYMSAQPSKRRFVLSSSYWEQQTNALLNFWSFQKWANYVNKNFTVVEPFAAGSNLGISSEFARNYNLTTVLRFRDYFDLPYWTSQTAKSGIPPMVKWEDFAAQSVNKVVVVILTYDPGSLGIYLDDDISDNVECKKELDLFYETNNLLIQQLQFEVARNVCYAFYRGQNWITLKTFNSYLLLEERTTLWFSSWRGIHRNRVTVMDKTLDRITCGYAPVLEMLKTSERVLYDSEKYVNKMLHVGFNNYSAVVIRTTSIKNNMVRNLGKTRSDVLDYFFDCVGQIKASLQQFDYDKTFLAVDLGRFGDNTTGTYFDIDSNGVYDGRGTELLRQAVMTVYGNKTVKEYEETFLNANGGISDSGYIGSMQKTIVENAKCILVMGGNSAFQRSLVINYKKKHKQNPCIKYLCYEDRPSILKKVIAAVT